MNTIKSLHIDDRESRDLCTSLQIALTSKLNSKDQSKKQYILHDACHT